MITLCQRLPRPVRTRVKATVVAFLAVGLLAGCGRSELGERDVTRTEIVGKWRGVDGGLLELDDAGRFTAEGLNIEAQPGAGVETTQRGLSSGEGEWFLEDNSHGPELFLSFTGGGAVNLYPADKKGELVLWGSLPDGDGAESVLTR